MLIALAPAHALPVETENVVTAFLGQMDTSPSALDAAHHVAEVIAKLIELVGVAVIALALLLATISFIRVGTSSREWRTAYERYRANLGRGILLGLELLVGADIIATVTSPLTALSVSLLGAIVVIRTFLSFSLETEIEGCWPWQRSSKREGSDTAER